jgi:hypothetical protein
MNVTEIIHLIEDAWREVPYPGDDKIFTPDSYDDEDIVNYFGGTTWRGHSPANLRAHSSAFTFFTPEAFHYWLPAFMIATIQSPEEADVIDDYIARHLGAHHAPKGWTLFSPVQRQAVAGYFRFQIDRFGSAAEDERKALRVVQGIS